MDNQNQEEILKSRKRRLVLFISAGLIGLLIIAGVFFYSIVVLSKLKKQDVYSYNPYEKIFSYAGAVIKEVNLDKKEIKADIIVSGIKKPLEEGKFYLSDKTYKEFVLKIADDAVLEGTEQWTNITAGQIASLLLLNDPLLNNPPHNLVIKKITVFK